jgi:TPR repeat protein
MLAAFASLGRCYATIALSLVAGGCGSPTRQNAVASPVTIPDSETPSAARVKDLVGSCPHAVAPTSECSELRSKAIEACNDQWANLCVETLLEFKANQCDPQIFSATDATLEYACGIGSWTSCAWLSGRLFKSGDEITRKRAFEMAQRTCRNGEADGCVKVGRMLAWWTRGGEASPEELSRIMEWTNRACELGSLEGCHDYAIGLLRRKQPSDAPAAHKLLEDQCAKDFEPSCVILGREERQGTFGAPNLERATSLWRKTCACGEMEGCLGMTALFFEHNDMRAAFAMAKHACANDSYDACSWLGKIYLQGKWVGRDRAQAHRYFEMACRRADRESCEAVQKIDSE